MFSSIKNVIDDVGKGIPVVILDDENRENEGDLIIAAEHVSAELINFMATYGRGLICLTMTLEQANRLNLSPMVGQNRSGQGTNFTVSIEAASGVTTGISLRTVLQRFVLRLEKMLARSQLFLQVIYSR